MVESVVMSDLRSALDYCGYDLDEVMRTKSRKRIYSDLRSIVWTIYCGAQNVTAGQASRAFGWDRATIYCAMARVQGLRKSDKVYADMYDAIFGAYMAYSTRDCEEAVEE